MANNPEKISALLQQVLSRVSTWLERDGASRIIVTRETIRELKQRELPEHVEIIPKKRRGKRKAVRKRRHYDEAQFKLAVWPQDAMDENSLPSLCCVVSGEIDFNVADYVLRCRAGDWIIFPPGVAKQDGSKPHFEGDPTGRSGDILWFSSAFNGTNCWLCRSEGNLHFKPENSVFRIEHHFIEKLFFGFCEEAMGNGQPGVMQQMLALLLLIITKEIQQGNILHTSGNRFHYQEESRQRDPIKAALEFIEDNLDHRLTINKVARQVLISSATFTKRFKERTGKTFVEYQTERRLEVAERMLLKTNISVIDVCARVGIKYGQLRLLFQEKHGCSPSKYREQQNTADIDS